MIAGSIIAHEVMHAWLRLSGYPRLPPNVEEGLCQLMAMLWLEQQPAEPEVRTLACPAVHLVRQLEPCELSA